VRVISGEECSRKPSEELLSPLAPLKSIDQQWHRENLFCQMLKNGGWRKSDNAEAFIVERADGYGTIMIV
jgi:hypothetical protein